MSQTGSSRHRVRLPADTELADRIAFGLTARQLTILGVAALLAYGVFMVAGAVLPSAVGVAAAAPVVAAGVLLALGRRHGLPGDVYARAALRFLVRPRLRLLAPEGIPAPLPGAPPRTPASALDLPVRAIYGAGLVELTTGGFCVLLRASAAGFALRSDEEQQALVEAFGRFLNSLTDLVQVAVRSEPADLDGWAARLERSIPPSVSGTVRAAASAHARFVAELASQAEVRRREIYLILTTRERDQQTAQIELARRAGEAVDALQAAGVELQPLDGLATAALIAHTLDPPGPPAGVQLTGGVG